MSVIGRVNIVHTQQLSTLRALSTVYVDMGIIVEIKAVFYKYTASSHTHTRTHAHALLRSCMDAYTHEYISILDTFTFSLDVLKCQVYEPSFTHNAQQRFKDFKAKVSLLYIYAYCVFHRSVLVLLLLLSTRFS